MVSICGYLADAAAQRNAQMARRRSHANAPQGGRCGRGWIAADPPGAAPHAGTSLRSSPKNTGAKAKRGPQSRGDGYGADDHPTTPLADQQRGEGAAPMARRPKRNTFLRTFGAPCRGVWLTPSMSLDWGSSKLRRLAAPEGHSYKPRAYLPKK